MVDTILDDVNELINLGKGDSKILERIKRASERNEVISVYERDYVTQLVETYLRPTPEVADKKTIKTDEIIKNGQSFEATTKPAPKKQPVFVSKSNPKTTKFAFGIGAIALAIILIVGVSQYEIDDAASPTPEPKVNKKMSGLVIDTDSSSYETGDIISISGSTDSPSSVVSLSINSPQGNVIWSEDVTTKSTGNYSTLVIVGGIGWENSGKYTLTASDGTLKEETSFDVKK